MMTEPMDICTEECPLALCEMEISDSKPVVPTSHGRKKRPHQKRIRTNPALSKQMRLHIARLSNRDPALAFGLQVSNLILRDAATLQADLTPESLAPDIKGSQRSRVIEQAKAVQEQMKAVSTQTTQSAGLEKKKRNKSAVTTNEPFRFAELPPEIRDMISEQVFISQSGRKPRLLWALKGHKDLYDAAQMVYYKTNNFKFSLKDSLRDSRIISVDQALLEQIRSVTLVISGDIQACTQISDAVLKPSNIVDLTLIVSGSDIGLRRATQEIVPNFKKLQKITVCILHPTKRPKEWEMTGNRDAYFKMFQNARRLLSKTLGHEGGIVSDKRWEQRYVWQGKDLKDCPKVFNPISQRVHIKFD